MKFDMLSLVNTERLAVSRPYSNISEYCLRGVEAVKRFVPSSGKSVEWDALSDYDLLAVVCDAIRENKNSSAAIRIKQAFDSVCLTDTEKMTAEEIWEISCELIGKKGIDELCSFDLDRIGIAVLPCQNKNDVPEFIGGARTERVICPFGTSFFDLKYAAEIYDNFDSIIDGYNFAAMFVRGFEFEVPNEYVAKKACEKLCHGNNITNKEKNILASQLGRMICLNCARESKELMVFLPTAPDVYSMGEFARLLKYVENVIKEGKLRVSVFAHDAVGLCFASSLVSETYKKITAETAVCGNGCGCAAGDEAVYWGAHLPTKRASLSVTPAYIGK